MTTDPAAAVRAREQEWIDVYLRADANAFAALLAEDFVYTSERGVFDKAAYVDNLRTGEIAMRDFRVGEREVRVYGEAAVATGVATLDAAFRGRDISGAERFTRLWVRDTGSMAWRAVALHASAVLTAEDAEPGAGGPSGAEAPAET
jgi:ketosteroid isomerase-like protein